MLKVLGGLLLAIGILIALASGTCMLMILPGMRTADMGVVLMIGGIPFVVGLGLVAAGYTFIKRP